MNKRMVSPDNIRLVNGVSAGLEVISWIIADPEDVVLVPEPTFKRFFSNMNERMKTNVIGFQLTGIIIISQNRKEINILISENENCPFVLSIELLEEAIVKQLACKKKVKGFIFCNPHNPLGVVYGKNLTKELMRVCAKYQIHFISDEIYALSIHDSSERFESVLQYKENEVSWIFNFIFYGKIL